MRELGETQQVIQQAKRMIDRLAPLKGKDPALLDLLGLLIGAAGVVMCFRIRKAPLSCILLCLGRGMAIPGLASVPGWLLTAGYGLYRAYRASESSSRS